MDGDHSAKTMEQGANSAMKGGTDLSEGIHESVNQIVCVDRPPIHSSIHSSFLPFPLLLPSLSVCTDVSSIFPRSPPPVTKPPAKEQACSPKPVPWVQCSMVSEDHETPRYEMSEGWLTLWGVCSGWSNWWDGTEGRRAIRQAGGCGEAFQCGWDDWWRCAREHCGKQ